MKREIKFRAWVKDKRFGQEMFNIVMISWMQNGEVILSGRGGSVHLKDCEIMQYTNLKDKNGKEIYEGDIFHIGDEKIKYIVEWHDSGLKGRQYNNKSYVGIDHWHLDLEIIGNIYENPELLK